MKNIMVDLETLGTAPGSAILSIGAVVFAPHSADIKDTFHMHLKLEDSVAAGFTVSASTMLWWLAQSEDARSGIIRGQVGAHAVRNVLGTFTDWCLTGASIGEVVMWGNGASFDNAVLSEAYRKLDMRQPWEFWNDRCYRTIKGEYPTVKLVREGVHHDALADAISQAKHLQAIYQHRKENAPS